MKTGLIKYHQQIIWILLIAGLVLFVANIPGLYIDIDEPWFGEQAYYLANDGIVRSEMFQDFLQYNERILVYHKAFIWAGAAAVKLFGLSLYGLRLVSLLSGLVLVLLLYRFCKKNYNMTIFRLTLIILVFCPLIFRNTILYRPEMMICAAGFASFFFLYEYLENERPLYLILGAALAGFSVIIHLNGIIFIGAGGILLLSQKKWGYFFVFGIISILVASFYFYEAIGNPELFKLQFMQDPSHAGANVQWYMPVKNLLAEHKRLFRKPEIIGITVLFLLSAFYWIKDKSRQRRRLIIYTFSLIILMGLINHNKTTKYAILMFPYFALMIADNINSLIGHPQQIRNITQKAFLAMLAITLAFGLYSNISLVIFGKEDWVARHKAVARHIPHDAKIIAPMRFMFNEIDNYDIIGLLPARLIPKQEGKDFTPENVCRLGRKYSARYIIINDEYRALMGCPVDDTTCMQHEKYKYLTGEYHFYIYKLENK